MKEIPSWTTESEREIVLKNGERETDIQKKR